MAAAHPSPERDNINLHKYFPYDHAAKGIDFPSPLG
jgi:hypothetical protein